MSGAAQAKRLLIVSQVYVPDPAAVGQYLHDVARFMVQRGFHVEVLTSAVGYEDPSARYPTQEVIEGVHIRRFALGSFGKRSIATRLVGGGSFLGQALYTALRMPEPDCVLVSTSPPMAPALAVALSHLRRSRLVYWVMDINPDQLVALGRVQPGSVLVSAFDLLNRQVLRMADAIVTLDEPMADRLKGKREVGGKLHVLPLWPLLVPPVRSAAHSPSKFRVRHGLLDKFVVMYSGNLSPCHPVGTILEAARRLRDRRLALVFVGGGAARDSVARFIAEHRLDSVHLLPYVPLTELEDSLSAADLHMISMGDAMVGIVHPSKIYNALAVGRPVLLLGPARSHLGAIVERHGVGYRVDHGNVEEAIAVLQSAMRNEDLLRSMGERSLQAAGEIFDRDRLCARLCAVIEGAEPLPA